MITKLVLERREIDLLRGGEAIEIHSNGNTVLLSAEVNGWTHMNGNGDTKARYGGKTAIVLETITKSPGLKASDIMKKVGIGGRIYWLLSKLQAKGMAKRDKKTGTWFPAVESKFVKAGRG